jgi:hypothetical protein
MSCCRLRHCIVVAGRFLLPYNPPVFIIYFSVFNHCIFVDGFFGKAAVGQYAHGGSIEAEHAGVQFDDVEIAECVCRYQLQSLAGNAFAGKGSAHPISGFGIEPVHIIVQNEADAACELPIRFDGEVEQGFFVDVHGDEGLGIGKGVGVREVIAHMVPDAYIVGEQRQGGRIIQLPGADGDVHCMNKEELRIKNEE